MLGKSDHYHVLLDCEFLKDRNYLSLLFVYPTFSTVPGTLLTSIFSQILTDPEPNSLGNLKGQVASHQRWSNKKNQTSK